MNFEKEGIHPRKSWTEVKHENDGGGARERRETKKNCLLPAAVLDMSPRSSPEQT